MLKTPRFESNVYNVMPNEKFVPFSDDQTTNLDSKKMFSDNIPEQNLNRFSQQPLESQSSDSITVKILIPKQDQKKEEVNNLNIVLNNIILDKNNVIKNKVKNEKFINKKRERSKNNCEISNKKKCGRKFKESDDIGEHTKNCDDNMISKIKTCIINAILVLLNNSFIYIDFNNTSSIDRKFVKIVPNIYTISRKDKNIELLGLTIKDLLNNDISSKNSAIRKDHNKELIKKIYNEQKETDIINILNLTFGEFLNFFRGKVSDELNKKLSIIKNIKGKFMNMTNFLEKIKKQEMQKGGKEEDVNEYIQKLRKLCLNYENWFEQKKSRNKGKKEKQN